MLNPYLAHQMAKERIKDALREAEQARPIWATESAERSNQSALHALLIKIRSLGPAARKRERMNRGTKIRKEVYP
jgi:HEPN domain-containing protein